ncbi:MAG: sel1 repeat family protein [Gammaproteobacteria bacterium]|nr:sel1 repeat family protein [Gammaproteobacteria bacterium]
MLAGSSTPTGAAFEERHSSLGTNLPLGDFSLQGPIASPDLFLGEGFPEPHPTLRLPETSQARADDLDQLIRAAEKGDHDAQYLLHLYYSDGTDEPTDVEKAIFWLEQAARSGHLQSLNDLGVLYLHGEGIDQDTDRAIDLFRRAANEGLPIAIYNLGALYETGTGLPQSNDLATLQYRLAADAGEHLAQLALVRLLFASGDYPEAIEWLGIASDNGSPEAKVLLGYLYLTGQGTPQNPERATALMLEAAEAGAPFAYFALALVSLDDSSGQPDVEQALAWLTRAVELDHEEAAWLLTSLTQGKLNSVQTAAVRQLADKGSALAQQSIAVALLLGGDRRNEDYRTEAAAWIRRAAEQGLGSAQEMLGQVYELGLGTEPDLVEAQTWYARAIESYREQAAAPGFYAIHCSYRLAVMLRLGRGTEPDLEESVYWLDRAAAAGSQEAQFDLAVAHLTGAGIAPDPDKSLQLFEALASNGLATAQLRLGTILMTGDTVPQDLQRSEYWLLRAAESGDTHIVAAVAEIFQLGQWSTPDYPQALRLYRQAAEQGSTMAMNSLGVMYKKGLGVEPDAEQAVSWYRKAAAGGDPLGMHNLGYAYHTGEGVPQNMVEAINWYRRAVALGNANAENNLANIYYNGVHLPRDYAEAVRLFENSANKGHAGAQATLGMMYRDGRGVERNDARALDLIRKAAEQDEPRALYELGRIYWKGQLGQDREFDKALACFRRARQLGIVNATVALGAMHVAGEGVQQDYAEAMRLYLIAAESGDVDAYYNIGQLYMAGQGVQQDYKQALSWHLKAARLDYPSSIRVLAEMYRLGLGVAPDHETANMFAYKAAKLGQPPNQYGLGVYDFNNAGEIPGANHDRPATTWQIGIQPLPATLSDLDLDGLEVRNLSLDGTDERADPSSSDGLQEHRHDTSAANPARLCERARRLANRHHSDAEDRLMWELFHKAADSGDRDCQMRLAVFYATGDGVEQDRARARQLFLAAAEQMSSEAFHNFGYFHVSGPPYERDYVAAYKWFWLASNAGRRDSALVLKKLEGMLGRQQIEQGEKEAREWLKLHGSTP